MFRLAQEKDLDAIAQIYSDIHDQEESHEVTIGWVRSIYPTRDTAVSALKKKDLYVEEIEGQIVASARINKEEVPEYKDARWKHEAEPEKIMVLHTLTVSPRYPHRGYGRAFVAFYEEFARENGCIELRMDTNAVNLRARELYKKLGYEEVDIVPCDFNGIKGISLVCLEKYIGQ